MNKSFQWSAVLVAAVAMGSVASTAFAVSITSNSSSTGFAVSSTDLIEGLSPTAISGSGDQEGLNSDTSGVALTNGLFAAAGIVNGPGPNPDLTIFSNNASVTYTLPANTNGYDITDINTYSAWRDGGRVNQDYNILYTTTTNAVFTSLTSVSQGYSGGNPTALEVLVSSVGLTNVTALRFDFPTTQNGFVGYREIDVLGVPSVPEPASVALLGLGAVGLALAARRRKA